MSLSVARYELGPVGTNCYVVRREASAAEAIVVDPGADVAELPQECAGILITHSHWDHLGGVASYASRTAARVYMPRLEAPVLAKPADWFPEIPLEPYDAVDHLYRNAKSSLPTSVRLAILDTADWTAIWKRIVGNSSVAPVMLCCASNLSCEARKANCFPLGEKAIGSA